MQLILINTVANESSLEKIIEFISEIAERYFLYDLDVTDYLNQILLNGKERYDIVKRLSENNLLQDEIYQLKNRNNELTEWFKEQVPLAYKRFDKFLNIKELS